MTIMNSAKKICPMSTVLSLALLALPLAACDGVDDDAAATAPAPAATAEREVISAVIGPDGQMQTTRFRIAESQFQEMLRRRLAAGSEETKTHDSSSVDRIQQAWTVQGSCGSSFSTWFFSGYNYTGSIVCLQASGIDATTTDMEYNVGFSIRSFISGYDRGLICTSNADCNLYQCGYGSSVWVDAVGNSPSVYQPPYQSYLSPHWVHMQPHAPFPCR
jgi:hypothetical protein